MDGGQVSPETLNKLRALANRLREKLAAMPLDDRAENQEAFNFIKTVFALTRMLERPDIERVLEELKKIDKTSIGNLLAFMHTFNLRFGPATTQRQREVYRELYPILDQTRDRVLGEAKLDNTGTGKTNNGKLHDFFSGMELEHIRGKNQNPTPPPRPNHEP
jgi:hypothetical protein